MSVESFLSSPCGAWCGQDEKGEVLSGADPSTWRDWLKDVLVALYERGDGFNGKRPNCESGWRGDLDKALTAHGVTMTDVVVHAFDRDVDPDFRLHRPGPRTKAALEAVKRVAMAEPRPAGSEDFVSFAVTALSCGSDPVAVSKGLPGSARTSLEAMKAADVRGEGGFVVLGYMDVRYVEGYLDQVVLNYWRKADFWRARSP